MKYNKNSIDITAGTMSRTRCFLAYNQSINSELPYLIAVITSH